MLIMIFLIKVSQGTHLTSLNITSDPAHLNQTSSQMYIGKMQRHPTKEEWNMTQESKLASQGRDLPKGSYLNFSLSKTTFSMSNRKPFNNITH